MEIRNIYPFLTTKPFCQVKLRCIETVLMVLMFHARRLMSWMVLMLGCIRLCMMSFIDVN
jgi:hypothetical protein